MGSYTIIGIPIQWLGLILGCAIFFLLFLKKEIHILKIQLPIILFIFWSFLITIASAPFNSIPMPELVTTNYEFFVFLRLLKLLSFLSLFMITIKIIKDYGYQQVITNVVNLGFVIAIYSFYTYFATLYELPEIPRNRLGTSGAEATTTFTYAFHRAIGTFLEPSHLGEWLSLPFLLSFINNGKLLIFKKLIMGLVIILTGSFGTILSICMALGLTTIILLIDFRRKTVALKMLNYIFLATLLIGISGLIINIIFSGVFLNQLSERFTQLTESGLLGSNRGYVYIFLENNSVPFIGYGLGNSNLFLTNILGGNAVMSFLSLYINTLYSSGIIGFTFLITAIIYPLFLVVINSDSNKRNIIFYVVWSYITLLILFIVNMEELTITFAISYALVTFLINSDKHAL
jgi:hypothetical protein